MLFTQLKILHSYYDEKEKTKSRATENFEQPSKKEKKMFIQFRYKVKITTHIILKL